MKRIIISVLCLLIILAASGCTTKKDADVSPDNGAELAKLRQAAIDAGFEVSDDYKIGTGDKLPKVLGGFRMTRKINDFTADISILEFQYEQYAGQYATGVTSGEFCRTGGRFNAAFIQPNDFNTESEILGSLNTIFESIGK